MIEISLTDCEKIVSAKLGVDFEIVEYQLIPFEEIIGYLGEHCTLKITVKTENASSSQTLYFFVKSLPKVEAQREFLEDFNGVVKERSFYTKYCALLKQNGISILDGAIPTCYYTTEDSFIFEDLSVQGYQTFPSRVPLKFDCVKAALKTLAKLHSSVLILEEVKKSRLVEDFPDELKESFYLESSDMCMKALQACRGGVRALIDLTYDGPKKKAFEELGIEGCFRQIEDTKPSKKFRNTICHADAYAKNLLFKFDKDNIDCVVIDFQTYRYGPPAQDVLAFLHLTTDREFRQKHMDDLLEFYYEELTKNIESYGFKDVVTKEEFEECCRFYKHYALMQTLIHFHVVILSDNIAKELFGEGDKARNVIFGDRYDFVKMVCERDPIYRHRSFEAINDLREFFESQQLL